MEEYKLLNSEEHDIQKLLNQWKHQYVLEITPLGIRGAQIIVLVKRTPK